MGRKAAGAEALAWTVAQGIDVVGVLTNGDPQGNPVKEEAGRLGLPLIDHAAAAAAVASGRLAYDMGVSFLYMRILREPFLSHPPRGTINFHPAPLPAYKGTGGYNLAVLEGHETWGVSAHYVDAGIDTGPIIATRSFPIDRDRATAISVERLSMEQLLALYRETISRAAATTALLPTTPNEGGRYVPRSEMEALKRIRPGDDVERKIRAFWFPPWPGAWVEVGGKPWSLVTPGIMAELDSSSPGNAGRSSAKVGTNADTNHDDRASSSPALSRTSTPPPDR